MITKTTAQITSREYWKKLGNLLNVTFLYSQADHATSAHIRVINDYCLYDIYMSKVEEWSTELDRFIYVEEWREINRAETPHSEEVKA